MIYTKKLYHNISGMFPVFEALIASFSYNVAKCWDSVYIGSLVISPVAMLLNNVFWRASGTKGKEKVFVGL